MSNLQLKGAHQGLVMGKNMTLGLHTYLYNHKCSLTSLQTGEV